MASRCANMESEIETRSRPWHGTWVGFNFNFGSSSSVNQNQSGIKRGRDLGMKKVFWVLLSFSVFLVATSRAIDMDMESSANALGLDLNLDLDQEVDHQSLNNVENTRFESELKIRLHSDEEESDNSNEIVKNRETRSIIDGLSFEEEEIKCEDGKIKTKTFGSWRCVSKKDTTSNHNGNSAANSNGPSNNNPGPRREPRQPTG